MKRKTFLRIIEKLKRLEAQSWQIIHEVSSSTKPLIVGSMAEVLRTCGKPNCRCAKKPSHLHSILMTTYQGRRRCQVIRKADVEKVHEKVERYRDIRKALKRLKAIDLERYRLLKAIIQTRNELYK